MNNDQPPRPSRRGFLKAGGAAVAAGLATSQAALAKAPAHSAPVTDPQLAVEPFCGAHQAGIVTPQQSHTYVAALDLTTDKRDDVIALLRTWTEAAARLTQGGTAAPLPSGATGDNKAAPDSGDVLGLGPC